MMLLSTISFGSSQSGILDISCISVRNLQEQDMLYCSRLFLLVSPKYSPRHVAQALESVSARELFRCHPKLRERLGGVWSDGYFVRSVGDQVTAVLIRRYIKLQHEDQLRFDF